MPFSSDKQRRAAFAHMSRPQASSGSKVPFALDYPSKSSYAEKQIALRKGEKIIEKSMGKKDFNELKNLSGATWRKDNTQARFSRDVDGKHIYSKSRERLHKKIVNDLVKHTNKPTRKPHVYFFGGVAASGKTSALEQYVKTKDNVKLDPDEIKKELAKTTPSPFPKYPLAHAGFLHEESSDINKMAMKKAMKERKNIIIDATLSDKYKTDAQIQKFKDAGYHVHLLGTQKKPAKAIVDAANRFVYAGRYVPLKIIAKTGNRINRNVWYYATHKKKGFESAKIVDTNKKRKKNLVVYDR